VKEQLESEKGMSLSPLQVRGGPTSWDSRLR
jgi:hypothetical protein